MGAWTTLLSWIHFSAIGVGGVATFGLPMVGAAIPVARPEARPALGLLAARFSVVGRTALAVLVLTGVLMLMSGSRGDPGWFWVKMGFVLALVFGVAAGLHAGRKGAAGDVDARERAALIGKFNIAIFFLIIWAAVLAFH